MQVLPARPPSGQAPPAASAPPAKATHLSLTSRSCSGPSPCPHSLVPLASRGPLCSPSRTPDALWSRARTFYWVTVPCLSWGFTLRDWRHWHSCSQVFAGPSRCRCFFAARPAPSIRPAAVTCSRPQAQAEVTACVVSGQRPVCGCCRFPPPQGGPRPRKGRVIGLDSEVT